MHQVGRLAGIARYPVKSMQGEAMQSAHVGAGGIAGDRAWALRDRTSGEVLSGKREPRLMLGAARTIGDRVEIELPNLGVHQAGDPQLDAVLSGWLGRDVRLERATADTEGTYQFQLDGDESAEVLDLPVMDGTFFDLAPIHLLTASSLRAAAELEPTVAWDVRRFRPTLLVDVDTEGFIEDAWTGTVTVGGLVCEVLMPTIRCAMPMRAQPGLPAAPTLMPALKRGHNSLLGLYLSVSRPGPVAIGDSVTAGP